MLAEKAVVSNGKIGSQKKGHFPNQLFNSKKFIKVQDAPENLPELNDALDMLDDTLGFID